MPPTATPAEDDDEATRTTRALTAYATTTPTDLYTLLSLSPTGPLTPSDLKRAWRKAALDHHPDKNIGREAESASLLDAARKAYDVLSDPVAKAAYDERVRAKREKEEREGRFEVKRRRMKEDLERRESAGWSPATGGGNWIGKRKVGVEGETEVERREREVRRLAADGARRRGEREERMRREREEQIEAKLAAGSKKRQRRKTGDGVDDAAGEDVTTPIAAPSSSSTPNRNYAAASNPSTPSFSFKKPGGGGGTGTPVGSNTPSLFEATMARLRAKEAERRRLEADIRDDDAAAVAADVKV